MEKSSPSKDCFDEYDPTKYETVAGEFESGDLVLHKSKIYIAKRNGSSSFIYASHSDMKAHRKLGSPSKNSLTKIRQKSQSPLKSPTNVLSDSSKVNNATHKDSAVGIQAPQKFERNLMNDFNVESEGESVAVLYPPLGKYFAAKVKNVQTTTITVQYSGYSDQAVETIRVEDVPTRLAKDKPGEKGFKEGDLAFFNEEQERYHVVIKDMSDWIWVENYDKPESADWIQMAGLKDVLTKLIKADPETFYGYKVKDQAIIEYNDAQYQCTVTSVTSGGVTMIVDGFKDEVLLNYQQVKTQLSKQDVARIFRSNQLVDSASAIITIAGVGLKSFTRLTLRAASGPIESFCIVDLSDNLIKMKVWDLISDGKLEAAGEFERGGRTESTAYCTVAIIRKDAAMPKVQSKADDNWLVPYWKDIAAQHSLCHLKRGASWNVSGGKYGLYTPKVNWQKEKDNYLRQNSEGSVPIDYVNIEQLSEDQPNEVETVFALSLPSI